MRVAPAVLLIAACGDRRAPSSHDDAGPPPPPVSTTSWSIRITDGDGGPPIAGRVLLFDAADHPVRIGITDLYEVRQAAGACAFAPDVLGTWDGILLANGLATIPIGVDDCEPSPAIPYGRYHVWAWRGPEHQRWDGDVDLTADRGRVATVIALERVWRPQRALVADLHVHAAASNDSLMPDPFRVVAQVAAGVQVIGLSDHNVAGDLADAIHATGLDQVVTSIASNELSGEIHIGVLPWPAGHVLDVATLEEASIDDLFRFAREVPGAPLIQLNHPRLRWAALYDDTGWDGTSWPPPFRLAFDTVEVLSGDTTYNDDGDRRLDRCIADFYMLIDRGFLVTAVGNSDTHHFNGIRDAVTRNYVIVDDPRVAPFDEAGFIEAIRRRQVWTTSGPLLEVEVAATDGSASAGTGGAIAARDAVQVKVTLAQPRWVKTDTVRVRIGGKRGPEIVEALPVKPGTSIEEWTVSVPLPATDTWIGVDAIGDFPMPPAITGSYLVEDGRGGGVPAALINPILVDVDGDGWWRRKDGRVKLDGQPPVGGRASLRRDVRPARRRAPITGPPPPTTGAAPTP